MFTRHVPVMCAIGNTFQQCFVDITLFLIVVFVLLVAFGSAFNVLYACTTEYHVFGNISNSVFSLFRGLLGDLDVAHMQAAYPVLTPVVFVLYVSTVLFIAFTILISIISEAYEIVKDRKPAEPLLTQAFEAVLGKDMSLAPDEAEVAVSLKDVLEAIHRLEARMDKFESHGMSVKAGLSEEAGTDQQLYTDQDHTKEI